MSTLSENHETSQALPPALSGDGGDGLVLIRTSPRETECSAPNRPYLTAVDEQQKRVLIYRPGCKLWSCPECSQQNRRQWTARIANGVRHYMDAEPDRPWWLITLTVHEKLYGFEKQHYVWKSAWSKLVERMRREADGKFRYVLLPELAPDTSRFHIHMMGNQSYGAKARKSPKKGYSCSWLHDNPRQCGLGYANDITPILTPAGAAAYTAGYIGKTLGVINWPTNFRRIRTTNAWPELPDTPNQGDILDWSYFTPAQFEAHIESAWRLGYQAINVTTGEMFEVIDFESA